MYERMLTKQEIPTMEDLVRHCGINGELYRELNDFLAKEWDTQQQIRFPYGNSYGWGVKHSRKNKLICDIFAEDQAFTLMLRMDNRQFEGVYQELLPYTREVIDGRYPCGDGGWIHYRCAASIWRMPKKCSSGNVKTGKIGRGRIKNIKPRDVLPPGFMFLKVVQPALCSANAPDESASSRLCCVP